MKRMGHTEIIKGLIMGNSSRDIYVYVPKGEGPFPLVLTHDGQFIFDMIPSTDYTDIGTAMNILIESGKIEPAIVVSIESTAHRLKTFEPWHHHEYIDFIENSLLPLLKKTYPIKHPFYTIGFSAGGQMALYLTLSKCLFDGVFAILPLWTPPLNINLSCKDKKTYIIVDSEDKKEHIEMYLPTGAHIDIDKGAAHSIEYFRNILPRAIQVLLRDGKKE